MAEEWLRRAARLGDAHRLSLHDAAWAAAALQLGPGLVSTDRRLLGAGLAESPTSVVDRLRP